MKIHEFFLIHNQVVNQVQVNPDINIWLLNYLMDVFDKILLINKTGAVLDDAESEKRQEDFFQDLRVHLLHFGDGRQNPARTHFRETPVLQQNTKQIQNPFDLFRADFRFASGLQNPKNCWEE